MVLAAVDTRVACAGRVHERCVCAWAGLAAGVAAVVGLLVRAGRFQERWVWPCGAAGLAVVAGFVVVAGLAAGVLVCAGRFQDRCVWPC